MLEALLVTGCVGRRGVHNKQLCETSWVTYNLPQLRHHLETVSVPQDCCDNGMSTGSSHHSSGWWERCDGHTEEGLEGYTGTAKEAGRGPGGRDSPRVEWEVAQEEPRLPSSDLFKQRARQTHGLQRERCRRGAQASLLLAWPWFLLSPHAAWPSPWGRVAQQVSCLDVPICSPLPLWHQHPVFREPLPRFSHVPTPQGPSHPIPRQHPDQKLCAAK